MSEEEYLALNQRLREGMAYLSRFAQSLKPAESTPSASVATLTPSNDEADTMDEEKTSEGSVDSIESTATSFIDEINYLNLPDTYEALFEQLERLGPQINGDQLEEILFLIPLFLTEEHLSHLLWLVRCNCPWKGQETRRCLRCARNICPVSSLWLFFMFRLVLLSICTSIVSKYFPSELYLFSSG
jgi:hypothetical protein